MYEVSVHHGWAGPHSLQDAGGGHVRKVDEAPTVAAAGRHSHRQVEGPAGSRRERAAVSTLWMRQVTLATGRVGQAGGRVGRWLNGAEANSPAGGRAGGQVVEWG